MAKAARRPIASPPLGRPGLAAGRQAKVSKCAQGVAFGHETAQEQRRGQPRRPSANPPRSTGRRRRTSASRHSRPTAAFARSGSVTSFAAPSSSAASSSSLANIAGRSGPSATRAAPVRVAKSMISSGSLLARLASASPRISRPSASVLSISTFSPLRLAMHVARAEGGGGHAVLDRRDQQVQPHRQPLGHDQPGQRQRMGRAAHVLLHQAHAAGRLDVEPAAVEADALADDGDLGRAFLAPAEARSAAARARGLRPGRPRRSSDSPDPARRRR